jgi:hypothetical protein
MILRADLTGARDPRISRQHGAAAALGVTFDATFIPVGVTRP